MKTLEDMKGLKVRSAGGLADKVLQNLGMVPVVMPASEAYEAAQRGVVDAINLTVTTSVSWKIYEVVPYQVRSDMIHGMAVIVMNLGVWNKLPEDLQGIIHEASRDAEEWYAVEAGKWEEAAWSEMERLGGMYVLPADEKARWREAVMPVWEEFEAANGVPGKEITKILRSYIK